MNLKNFQIDAVAALIMSFGAAAFFGIGRFLVGAEGWFIFMTLPASIVIAVLLLALWTILVRIDTTDSSGASHKVFGWQESWSLIATSTFLFLAGFFLVDFTDVAYSEKSVFTLFVGQRANDVSEVLFLISCVGAGVSYIVGFVAAVRGRIVAQA